MYCSVTVSTAEQSLQTAYLTWHYQTYISVYVPPRRFGDKQHIVKKRTGCRNKTSYIDIAGYRKSRKLLISTPRQISVCHYQFVIPKKAIRL